MSGGCAPSACRAGLDAAAEHPAASDFRRGNRPPNYENSGFIKRCIRALPSGVKVTRVRIDAAGWSKQVIGYCHAHGIGCAIRAKSCDDIRFAIASSRESGWQPLRRRDGALSQKESTLRMLHVTGGAEEALAALIQRRLKDEADDGGPVQQRLEMLCGADAQTIDCDRYVYRAIGTSLDVLDGWDDSGIVRWYSRRGDCSDYVASLPCSDHQANALRLSLSAFAAACLFCFASRCRRSLRALEPRRSAAGCFRFVAGLRIMPARRRCGCGIVTGCCWIG